MIITMQFRAAETRIAASRHFSKVVATPRKMQSHMAVIQITEKLLIPM
jgi:hypothetical protein